MYQCDVLIIGLGPSGMFIANEMQKHNINYFVVDKRKVISNITRAVNVTPASMALLKFSIKLDIENKAIKTDFIKAYWDGKIISRISYRYQNFPYRNLFYFPQPQLEKALYENIQESRIFEETTVTSIQRNEDSYIVELLDKNSNKISIKCQYIIGSDGNNSFVRQWSNIQSEEEDYNSNFLLFDIETKKSITKDSSYYLFEDGYMIIVPIDDRQYRIILSSKDLKGSNGDCFNNIKFIREALNKHCKIDVIINKIVWFTQANFRHRIADFCHEGNIFLVGDAFHIFSPVGGLNLSTGIQDAANLGWKLAYVIKGYAGKDFLYSYAIERMAAVNNVREKTQHLTHVLTNAKNYFPAQSYITSFSNRYQLKHELPKILSGYDQYPIFPASKSSNKFQQGHHFSEFIKHRHFYEKICKSLDSRKFNLLTSKSIVLNLKAPDYLVCSVISDLNLENIYILIRPDGYIQKIGKITDISDLQNYFEQYLGVDRKCLISI